MGIIILFVLLLFWAGPFAESILKEQPDLLTIRDVTITIERADTPAARARGLSGRAGLAENTGMLFVLEASKRHSFWMKDMNFPIDIIWIDEHHTVVDITREAKPASFPDSFAPAVPARYVLEVNAGFADHHRIKIGDTISF